MTVRPPVRSQEIEDDGSATNAVSWRGRSMRHRRPSHSRGDRCLSSGARCRECAGCCTESVLLALSVLTLPPAARRDAAQVFGKCVDVADDVPFLIVAGISKHDRSARAGACLGGGTTYPRVDAFMPES